ncbi:hypothetical protein Tco_0326940 [Tanacetum coccineum]
MLFIKLSRSGSKDRPPMFAGNYVQWKSRIKRYIDTKPNIELQNPPYTYQWAEKRFRIDNDIYATVDACPEMHGNWKA